MQIIVQKDGSSSDITTEPERLDVDAPGLVEEDRRTVVDLLQTYGCSSRATLKVVAVGHPDAASTQVVRQLVPYTPQWTAVLALTELPSLGFRVKIDASPN